LEQVILKGLSKEATQRYADMLDFATAFVEASYISTAPYTPAFLPVTTFSSASSYQYSPRKPSYNVPVPLTLLTGRERELQTAHNMLKRPDVRRRHRQDAPG
jgi:hypothetical protein